MENGNEDAKNAVDIMIYRIIKYIGAYFVALDGADAIALTAGIGENNAMVRERIMKGLAAIGVVPDLEANAESGREHILTKPESKVAVWVIPTNEELAIARETVRLVKK